MELKKEEFNWTEQAVVGMALLMQGGSIDSFGNQISCNVYYEVGKHKEDGKVAILPTERKTETRNEFINSMMKRRNMFN